MGCYEPDCDYYEPSEAEIFFDEMKENFKKYLSNDIKQEMTELKDKNEQLTEKVKKLEFENYSLKSEADKYIRDKNKLKQEVEDEFYQMNVIDVMNKVCKPQDVWYPCRTSKLAPKCEYCDDDRCLTHTFENGTVAKVKCNCNTNIYTYQSELCQSYEWSYHKTKGREKYLGEKRKFYVSNSRNPSEKDCDAYDSYCKFKIINVYDNAQEVINNKENCKAYGGERFGFTSKEECQKYCDMLNKEE